MRPVSHYGISKAAMEMIMNLFSPQCPHMDIIVGRLFNLIGQGMSADLLPGRLKKKINQLFGTEQDKTIHMGNLCSYRDFLDVRDAARAFVLLAKKGKKNNAYNVASGRRTQIKELVGFFMNQAKEKIKVVSDDSLFKPIDPPMVIADISKIGRHIGWQPAIDLEKSIENFMAG